MTAPAPKVERGVFECVLPESGEFAHVRRIKWGDMLDAGVDREPLVALVARVAYIEGKQLTPAEWRERDYLDIAPIILEVDRRLKAAQQSRGVA